MEGWFVESKPQDHLSLFTRLLQRYALLTVEPAPEEAEDQTGLSASEREQRRQLLRRAMERGRISADKHALYRRIMLTWGQQPLLVRETMSRVINVLQNWDQKMGNHVPRSGSQKAQPTGGGWCSTE
ncbi:MAG: hypothetical protein HY567_04155 [Candidatus Kerfeldbacteria bacterium]|nr:hypothetical protein [Candidatus Kerfeldbacteria bacterium]